MERLPILMVDRIETVKISILQKGNTYSQSSGNSMKEDAERVEIERKTRTSKST